MEEGKEEIKCPKVVLPSGTYLQAKASGDTEEEIGYHHAVL